MKPTPEHFQRASDYSPAGPVQGNGTVDPVAGSEAAPTKPALGLWDAVSIIVGIVVGAGIYQTAPFILKHVDSPQTALITWGVAGILSLVGALCYAELATAYPRDGGDIVYLSRAFGRWTGFLFGWVQLTVILTGSIGMMAFVFANYAIRLFGEAFGMELGVFSTFAFAGGAVLLLTITNILGVVFGKLVQNVLTLAKIAGLGAIIFAGFYVPKPDAWAQPGLSLSELQKLTFPGFAPSLGVAMVLILYTYGGWNDAAFVAAEVKNGKKNITRALVLGILIITVLYLLVNAAYINSLGFRDAQGSRQIAADVLNNGLGKGGVSLMCVLVMVSALGAVNGLIFTGARVYSTIGKDYPLLSWMGGWDRKHGAPVPALVTQGILALGLIFLAGTTGGRESVNRLLAESYLRTDTVVKESRIDASIVYSAVFVWASPSHTFADCSLALYVAQNPRSTRGENNAWTEFVQKQEEQIKVYALNPMEWEDSYKANLKIPEGEKAAELAKGGFDTLLTCTAPVFWVFFLLTGISLFVLRERDKEVERPFRVAPYPELPLIFCLSCGYMLYSSISYALERQWKGGLFLLGVAPLVIGVVLYRISRLLGKSAPAAGNNL
jgi:APA family basic amino acid/polyamine antiporter